MLLKLNKLIVSTFNKLELICYFFFYIFRQFRFQCCFVSFDGSLIPSFTLF